MPPPDLPYIYSSAEIAGSDQQQRDYDQFKKGNDIAPNDINILLEDIEVPGTLENVKYGYFRKIMASISNKNTPSKILKIALDPTSQGMLAQEAIGYEWFKENGSRLYRIPNFELLHTKGATSVACLEFLKAGTLKPIQLFHLPPPISTLHTTSINYEKFLASLEIEKISHQHLEDFISTSLKSLKNKFSISQVHIAPSHGDFVYWNILKPEQGAYGLIDFEYFSFNRISDYDKWYWFLLPIVRKSIRFSMLPNRSRMSLFLGQLLWKRQVNSRYDDIAKVSLSLTLLDHLIRMAVEHANPEIIKLIGKEAYDLRVNVMRAYIQIIDILAS